MAVVYTLRKEATGAVRPLRWTTQTWNSEEINLSLMFPVRAALAKLYEPKIQLPSKIISLHEYTKNRCLLTLLPMPGLRTTAQGQYKTHL